MADSWQEIDGVLMDWENPKLGHAWHYLETLRRALQERTKAAWLNYPQGIFPRYRYSSYVAEIWHEPISNDSIKMANALSVMKAIDDVVFATTTQGYPNRRPLFTRFFNHVKTQPIDAQTLPDTWTEAEILDEIGDTEIVPPVRIGVLKNWLIQRYKILNLLRKVTGPIAINSAHRGGSGTTWADALAAYNAATWLAQDTGKASTSSEIPPGFPKYSISAYKTISQYFGFPAGPLDWGVNYDDMMATISVYFFGGGNVDVFGYTPNTLNKIAIAGESYFNPNEQIGSAEIMLEPPQHPLSESRFSASLYAGLFERKALYEFDGDNGFKFRGENWT